MTVRYSVTIDRDVAIPMRDGVVLRADWYRPSGQSRLPTLLIRTPYNKENQAQFPIRAAGAGFAVVVQDTRGRWASDGQFHAFRDERNDGFDTCAWIVDQPWSNGRIGMFGGSYVGATQWQAALGGAPGLETIVPYVTASDYHEGWCYQGGAFELGFSLSWTLGVLATDTAQRLRDTGDRASAASALLARIDGMDAEFARLPVAGDPLLDRLAPYYREWLEHPEHGDYWANLKIEGNYGRLDLPTLNVGGWYDIFLGGTIANFSGMRQSAESERARQGSRLLVGPWTHYSSGMPTPIGEYFPGTAAYHAALDWDGMQLRWFDHWLRDADNGVDHDAPVRIFVMGANVWRDEREWPPARAEMQAWYLHSGGRANTLNGDGVLSREEPASGQRPDSYRYDPLDPVPTNGGALCCHSHWADAGAMDQRAIEARDDVLCYTSEPLAAPMEVTGPIHVILHAASSAADTDFTAKLVDVAPCGCARNITDGIIRARYRHSTAQQVLLEPGEPVELTIDLWSTSMLFAAGHRLRLEISSSNFPRFDRNPNTGGVIARASAGDCVVATQTVLHDLAHPSRIMLPVMPVG